MRRAQRIFILLGLALLVTGCAKDPWGPMTEDDRNEVACRGYGFYPGTKEYDDCMRFVETRRGDPRTPSLR